MSDENDIIHLDQNKLRIAVDVNGVFSIWLKPNEEMFDMVVNTPDDIASREFVRSLAPEIKKAISTHQEVALDMSKVKIHITYQR